MTFATKTVAAPDKRMILVIAVLLGLVARLVVAWQPAEELAWRVTADDAYYYFRLAQNLGQGLGATFDGLTQTNGFHPIYALLLIPIFGVTGPDQELGVHLALTLVALFSVATAWPIYRIGRQLGAETVGLVGAVLQLLNPWTIMVSMTGVESAVYIFCFAWTVDAYLQWRNDPRLGGAVKSGLWAGLTIMARSEGGLLLIALLLDILWRGRKQLAAAWKPMFVMGAVAALVCLPWAIWSTLQFGSPLQASGGAITLLTHADRPADGGEQWVWFGRRTLDFMLRYGAKLVVYNFLALVAIGVALVGRARNGHGRQADLLRYYRPLQFLWLPLVAAGFYYNVIMWHQQHWYFSAPILIVTLFGAAIFGAFVEGVAPDRRRARLADAAVLVATVVCMVTLAWVWNRGLYGLTDQLGRYRAGNWLAQNAPADGVFGATDNGLLGYYCQCPMINLEGVMNNEIYADFRASGYTAETMGAYVTRKGIRYISLPDTNDGPATIGSVALQRVFEIPGTRWVLYEARGGQE